MERLSTLPGHNCDYLSKGYWNLRYISEDNFEWCKGYQEFKPLITKYVGKNDRVLILGKFYDSVIVYTLMNMPWIPDIANGK